jgi:hypothetical protein
MFTVEDQELDWPLLSRQPDRLDRWAVTLVLTATVLGIAIAVFS